MCNMHMHVCIFCVLCIYEPCVSTCNGESMLIPGLIHRHSSSSSTEAGSSQTKPELTDMSCLHTQPVLGVSHPCLGDSNCRGPPHLLSIYLDSGDKNSGSHLPRP